MTERDQQEFHIPSMISWDIKSVTWRPSQSTQRLAFSILLRFFESNPTVIVSLSSVKARFEACQCPFMVQKGLLRVNGIQIYLEFISKQISRIILKPTAIMYVSLVFLFTSTDLPFQFLTDPSLSLLLYLAALCNRPAP